MQNQPAIKQQRRSNRKRGNSNKNKQNGDKQTQQNARNTPQLIFPRVGNNMNRNRSNQSTNSRNQNSRLLNNGFYMGGLARQQNGGNIQVRREQVLRNRTSQRTQRQQIMQAATRKSIKKRVTSQTKIILNPDNTKTIVLGSKKTDQPNRQKVSWNDQNSGKYVLYGIVILGVFVKEILEEVHMEVLL